MTLARRCSVEQCFFFGFLLFGFFIAAPSQGRADEAPDSAAVPPEIQDPSSLRLNTVERAGTYTVEAELLGPEGEQAVQTFSSGGQRVVPGDSTTLTLTKTVEDPAKWTAETPTLYPLLLTLRDEQGHGLQVGAVRPINVAARPYTDETLAGARHTYDLTRAETVTVHLDAGLHGVGGDDSWGERTHPQYTVPANHPHRLQLWFRPLTGSGE